MRLREGFLSAPPLPSGCGSLPSSARSLGRRVLGLNSRWPEAASETYSHRLTVLPAVVNPKLMIVPLKNDVKPENASSDPTNDQTTASCVTVETRLYVPNCTWQYGLFVR